MKYFPVLILTLLSTEAFADAGFSVSRKKAMAVIRLTGIENLQTHKLIHITGFYEDRTDPGPYANKGHIVENGYETTVQEGGRYWHESERNVKFILVDVATGTTTDSLQLFAKEHNFNIRIGGDKDGKLQYTIDSTNAMYQYGLVNDREEPLSYGRNRLIFIACSAIGFLLLAGLFILHKKKILNKPS